MSSLLGLFWRENARGPYRVIRTSGQPIRKLNLGYGPGVTDPKKNKQLLDLGLDIIAHYIHIHIQKLDYRLLSNKYLYIRVLKQQMLAEDDCLISSSSLLYDVMNYCGLSFNGNDFLWKGSIDELKELVQSKLKLDGSWSSPGGDVKLFVCARYSLKWYGKYKEKLAIITDDDDQSLSNAIKKLAALSDNLKPTSQTVEEPKMATHPVTAIEEVLHNTIKNKGDKAENLNPEIGPNVDVQIEEARKTAT